MSHWGCHDDTSPHFHVHALVSLSHARHRGNMAEAGTVPHGKQYQKYMFLRMQGNLLLSSLCTGGNAPKEICPPSIFNQFSEPKGVNERVYTSHY